MERKPLSIREFASVCQVSHTEIKRRMESLGITGQPQGRGKPTLLSTDDQDAIARTLFTPAPPSPSPHVDSTTGGLDIYRPAPLATMGTDGSAARYRGEMQLGASVHGWKGNMGSFRNALKAMARETGTQLGAEMFTEEMNAAMATYQRLQTTAGKDLGVIATPPDGSAA